jgi:DNA-damage-inducible protein D
MDEFRLVPPPSPNDYESYKRGLEAVKKATPNGTEYWMARDLMPLLAYSNWANFAAVIEKARMAAKGASAPVDNHFAGISKMVPIGSGAERERADWYLSRYACYLIAMNADSSKPEVGHAMTYFAGKTRQMEQLEQGSLEEQERLKFRLRTIAGNKRLVGAARKNGVRHFDWFQDAGHKGFYGMGVADVKEYKGIPANEELLDHLGSLELSAHDFKQKVTEERLNNSTVKTEEEAIKTHKLVGEEVRAIVRGKNGKNPEDLPAAPSIKKLVNQHRKKIRPKTS